MRASCTICWNIVGSVFPVCVRSFISMLKCLQLFTNLNFRYWSVIDVSDAAAAADSWHTLTKCSHFGRFPITISPKKHLFSSGSVESHRNRFQGFNMLWAPIYNRSYNICDRCNVHTKIHGCQTEIKNTDFLVTCDLWRIQIQIWFDWGFFDFSSFSLFCLQRLKCLWAVNSFKSFNSYRSIWYESLFVTDNHSDFHPFSDHRLFFKGWT